MAHFTIEADFLHTHARRLWSEGEFDKAMRFLDSLIGISGRQKRLVLMGRMKFEEVGNTQEFVLVKDDWKPDLGMCHFMQYPDPGNEEQMVAARLVLLKDWTRKQYSARLTALLDKIEDNTRAQNYLRDFMRSIDMEEDCLDEDFAANWDEMEKNIDALYRVAQLGGYRFGKPIDENGSSFLAPSMFDVNVDQFLKDTRVNYQIEQLAEEKVKPKPGDVYENGIITPDGSFYRCGAMGHNVLAIALGYSEDNSNSQFAALQDALAHGCAAVACNLAARHVRKGKGGITAAQKKRIQEWFELTQYSKAPFIQYDYEDLAE